MFLQHVTCHFLHIVNPLILHGFKMLIGRLITRVSQQNAGSRYDLLRKKTKKKPKQTINYKSNSRYSKAWLRQQKTITLSDS